MDRGHSIGAVDAWERVLGATATWRAWSAPSTTCPQIRGEIMWQMSRHMPGAEHGMSLACLKDTQSSAICW